MIVFVSSTYRDLIHYREVLRLALETSGYNFRGMEHFPAQQPPPLDVCLTALEDCDVYVGIMGGIYGRSPPRRVISYTELEYDHAQKLNIYTIWLILDSNANVKPPHVEQDSKRLDRLNRFRNKILRNHTVQTFCDPHEVSWKILAALRTYEVRLHEQQRLEVQI